MRNKVLAALLAATMVAASVPALTMAADLTPTVDPSKGTPTVTEETEELAGGTRTVTTETYDDGTSKTTTVSSVLASGGERLIETETVVIDADTGIKEAYKTTYDDNGNLLEEIGFSEGPDGSKVLTVSSGATAETVTQVSGSEPVVQTVDAQGSAAWIGAPVEIGGEVIDPDVLGKGALTGNQTLKQAKLDVSTIENKAANNTELEEIDASTVTQIGKKAFFDNEKLEVTYLNPQVKIKKKAFSKSGKNQTFYAVTSSKSDKKAVKNEIINSGYAWSKSNKMRMTTTVPKFITILKER